MKNSFSFVKLAVFAQLRQQEGRWHGVWELRHQLDAVLHKSHLVSFRLSNLFSSD